MASLILVVLTLILVPIAINLGTNEMTVYAPEIAKWLVGKAVKKLASKYQAAYSAEWLAVVDDTKGPLAKIWFGLHLYLFGATQLHRMLRPKRHPYYYPKVRIAVEVSWFVMMNIVTARRTIPALLKAAARGHWNNIKFLFASQRLIIRTSMLSQMRKDTPSERIAALNKVEAEIKAIIDWKSPPNKKTD